MKTYALIAAGLIASTGLVACGGSSTAPPVTPAVTNTISLTGVVAKGPIANGTVTVTDGAGAVLTTTTDAYGAYAINLPFDATPPFSVEISGGTDTVTGKAPDFPLKAIVPYSTTGQLTQVNANANVFTTVVAAAATAAAGGATPTAAQLKTQETSLVKSLGMGLPANTSPSSDTTIANTGAIMAANEALAEVIRRSTVAKVQNGAAGATATSVDMLDTIASLAADISDGAMDGYAAPAAIKAAVANTGASNNVTAASITTSSAVAASKATSVVVEAFNNGGSVDVTDTSGAVAKTAATVKTSLETAAAKAAVAVAKSYADASAASVGTAPTIAVVKIVAPAASAVTNQAASSTAVAAKVAATAATNADAAVKAASGANATATQIADAKVATAAANTASQAASAASTSNVAATNAVVAAVVKAGGTASAAQTAAATAAATAETNAAAVATAAALADSYAQADQLAAAATAAADAKAKAAAADAAAKAAAANAAAVAKATGVVITGNTVTIGGKALTVSSIGAATMTNGVTIPASPLTLEIPLTDYYASLATPLLVPVQVIIYDHATPRRINATLEVQLSSTQGAVTVTVPTGNMITYSGRTVAGSILTGTMAATAAITSNVSVLKIDIAALAKSAGIAIKPATYTMQIGVGNVLIGFDNAGGTGLDKPLPSMITGKAINVTFNIQ